MAWNLNGFIHSDTQIHVDVVKVEKEHYHIILKNKRRITVPREQFKTSDVVELFNAINLQIHIQAHYNVYTLNR
jgi:hypothetical protein